jgi:hypothetical protein
VANVQTVSEAANLIVIAGLILYGFILISEYYAKGRWAKNVTGLLAGFGVLSLAVALILRPSNAQLLFRISHSAASSVFLWVSNCLLLAAMLGFGLITYLKPLRLWYERRIERNLHRGLPKIP